MAATVTLKGNLTITDASQTLAIAPSSNETYTLTDPEKMASDRNTLSSTIADLSLGSVGWTDLTFGQFKNMSDTPGEDATILLPPLAVAGGTDDGQVAGASLTNTLTGAGYFKTISADGTSQGKTWKKGDIAVYLGTSGAYLQLRPKAFFVRPGKTLGPFRAIGDGDAWQAFSAAGTPQLAFVVGGQLTE